MRNLIDVVSQVWPIVVVILVGILLLVIPNKKK